MRNEKYKEADELAADLVAGDPDDPNALFALAAARLAQGKARSAYELFDEAEARAGESVGALLNMATFRLDQWRYADAEALARQALALDPSQARIFFVLSECALAQKRPSEAYDLALEALRLDPNDKETLRLIARAQARRNPLLKPFLSGVDWIIEMDRQGLLLMPFAIAPVGLALWGAIDADTQRIARGLEPAIVISLVIGAAFAYLCIVYAAAAFTRWRIRRDLKRIALPNF